MSSNKYINLPVHADDAILLIGVLEHAIAEGARNLTDAREGRATFDVSINDAQMCLLRLRAWVRQLHEGHPGANGPKAEVIGLSATPAKQPASSFHTLHLGIVVDTSEDE
jgi:hypothetical protein